MPLAEGISLLLFFIDFRTRGCYRRSAIGFQPLPDMEMRDVLVVRLATKLGGASWTRRCFIIQYLVRKTAFPVMTTSAFVTSGMALISSMALIWKDYPENDTFLLFVTIF